MEPTPDEHNANRGTERGREALRHSLATSGAGRSILLDASGRIIAGNKTFEAARELGLPVRVVRSDGKELIAVAREDLDLDDGTDTRARELAYADNRVAELDLSWDIAQMAQDMADGAVNLESLWSPEELATLLASLGQGEVPPQATVFAPPEERWLTWQVSFPADAVGIVADTLTELKVGLPDLRWNEGE